MSTPWASALRGITKGEDRIRERQEQDRQTKEREEDRALLKQKLARDAMADSMSQIGQGAKLRQGGITISPTNENGEPLERLGEVGEVGGQTYYYNRDRDLAYMNAKSLEASRNRPPNSPRQPTVSPLDDEEAEDVLTELLDAGKDPQLARVAVTAAKNGNYTLLNVLTKPTAAGSSSSTDPNTRAATATNRAIVENSRESNALTRAMPTFPTLSINPQADSASVINARQPLLEQMGETRVRGDSLRSAYDKHASAINSGSTASGAVDVSAKRTQVEEARRKLRAIVDNPNAPLSAKAKAQDAFKRLLASFGLSEKPE